MNIWVIEHKAFGKYYPLEIAYSRDHARAVLKSYKKRLSQRMGIEPNTIKTRIRRYQQDCFSRG